MSEWELPKNVETQSIERVGGGFAWESGVYDATVKMVYLNQSASEAVSFNVILEKNGGNMAELRENFWIKSGKAKGNKTYYTKNGKAYPLPGYSIANSMCVAVTGESLAKCMESTEKKIINIWNPELKKEAPTERPVIMGLVGKPVKVAVHQVVEDKTAKNDKGEYVPTGASRTVNQCKFFGNAEGKTAEEITNNEDATRFDKWAQKNTGTIVDKSTKDKGSNSAASIMGSTPTNTTTDSLFQTDPPI
jgi:predicted transcriptional regulator